MAKFIKVFHCFNFESEDSEIFQIKEDEDMKTVIYNKVTLRQLYKHGWVLQHIEKKVKKHSTSFIFFVEKESNRDENFN